MTHNLFLLLLLWLSNNLEHLAWSCSHFGLSFSRSVNPWKRDILFFFFVFFDNSLLDGSLMIWFPFDRSYSSIVRFLSLLLLFAFPFSLSLRQYNSTFSVRCWSQTNRIWSNYRDENNNHNDDFEKKISSSSLHSTNHEHFLGVFLPYIWLTLLLVSWSTRHADYFKSEKNFNWLFDIFEECLELDLWEKSSLNKIKPGRKRQYVKDWTRSLEEEEDDEWVMSRHKIRRNETLLIFICVSLCICARTGSDNETTTLLFFQIFIQTTLLPSLSRSLVFPSSIFCLFLD